MKNLVKIGILRIHGLVELHTFNRWIKFTCIVLFHFMIICEIDVVMWTLYDRGCSNSTRYDCDLFGAVYEIISTFSYRVFFHTIFFFINSPRNRIIIWSPRWYRCSILCNRIDNKFLIFTISNWRWIRIRLDDNVMQHIVLAIKIRMNIGRWRRWRCWLYVYFR